MMRPDTAHLAPAGFFAALKRTADRTPDTIAIVDDDGTPRTYRDLHERAGQLAAVLRDESGAGPGSRVALALESGFEYCVAVHAVNALGAIIVPVPTKFRAPEIRDLLTRSGCDVAFVEERFRQVAESAGIPCRVLLPRTDLAPYPDRLAAIAPVGGPRLLAEPASPDAPAILMFTSGTTSRSKGVLMSNRNVGSAVRAYVDVLGLTAADSCLLATPIYHVTGIVAVLGVMVHVGGVLRIHRRFDARRVLQAISDHAVSFVHASPTVFARLLEHREDFPELPSWRLAACGAAHMPVERIRALRDWLPGLSFRTVYGLTETTSPATIMPGGDAWKAHAGSSGRPIPGMEIRIDARPGSGAASGIAAIGPILLRGPTIMMGYIDGVASFDEDGWFDTGDVGYLDDGFLYVVDRTKDMINCGGEKVWCIDLEENLRAVPGVQDALVVGIPDSDYGEVPAALLVASHGSTPPEGDKPDTSAVVDFLASRVARYSIPKRVLWVDRIPVTPNLKPDKVAARALFANASDHDPTRVSA